MSEGIKQVQNCAHDHCHGHNVESETADHEHTHGHEVGNEIVDHGHSHQVT